MRIPPLLSGLVIVCLAAQACGEHSPTRVDAADGPPRDTADLGGSHDVGGSYDASGADGVGDLDAPDAPAADLGSVDGGDDAARMPDVPEGDGPLTDAPASDGPVQVPPPHCQPTPGVSGLFQVRFMLQNSGRTYVHLERRCDIVYEISSCASGFADNLGPSTSCLCTGCPVGLPCPVSTCESCPPTIRFDASPGGAFTVHRWPIHQTTGPDGSSCLPVFQAPAGIYRLTIPVYDRMDHFAMGRPAARMVTVTFELPFPPVPSSGGPGYVRVELSASPVRFDAGVPDTGVSGD